MRGFSLRRAAAGLLPAAVVAGLLVVAPVAGAVASPAPTPAAPTPHASASATPAPSASRASAAPASTPAPTPSATAPTASPAPTAPAGRTLALDAVDLPVLTLPAGDGLRDSMRLRIRAGVQGDLDVVARQGRRTVRLVTAAPLLPAGAGWQRTVHVRTADLGLGRWQLIARRTDTPGVRASTSLRVGSGLPVSVSVLPKTRTLQPYRDGVLDALDLTVIAADETGVALPVSGTVRIDVGTQHRTRALQAGAVHMSVIGLPVGAAVVTAAIRTAGGTTERTTPMLLTATAVSALRLTTSADTVQPVADGLLDTVTLTTSGTLASDSPAPMSGSLTVAGLAGTVKRWTVPSGAPATFSWDGRVHGVIAPGVYTVTLTLRGPEGGPRSRAMNITVSKDHLPYRVRDLFGVADGDQQGLAVHDGLFYVATDVGAGSARIDVYDAKGVRTRSIGPLAIGHGAALSFSTTTGTLYAANGGAAFPTTVWAIDPAANDPASVVKETIDLSALGPNGMVAVDDAGGRLLVFAGAKGAFTLSAVGFDGVVQRTVPIVITGVPQGMEVVGTELWLYTSLKGRNRLAKYAVTNDAVISSSTGTAAFDLMNPGEGEGFAFSGVDGAMYVGAHGPNRVGVLEPVADE